MKKALQEGSRGAFPQAFGVVLGEVVKQDHARGVPSSHPRVPAALAAGVRRADDLSELCGRGAQVPARGSR